MEDIITRVIPMPIGTKGVTVKDSNDDYNVYINSLYSYEVQVQTYNHEKGHILMGHFWDNRPVIMKEDEIAYK